MKLFLNAKHAAKTLTAVTFAAGMFLPLQVFPAAIELATKPLSNATTTSVLPNLMFIMDGSRSMGWNYLPDWVVEDNLCKGTNGTYNTLCATENDPNYLPAKLPYHPPFLSPDFNSIYYNPDIYYKPPVNSDGTSKPSQGSPWTSVKDDAYGIQSTASTNLITNYPDLDWCTTARTNGVYTDCLRNNNYILPGSYSGKSYTTQQQTTASGSAKFIAGAPNSPSAPVTRNVGPHYYRIIAGEYCDSTKLNNCQATETTTYKYAAKLRWCNSANNADADNPAANTCQALRTGSFTFPRYPTRYAKGVTNRGRFERVDIVPGQATYPPSSNRAVGRTDCASSTSCTYTEEMTNFANWWTYYRTRMQTMKTSASNAFREIDNRYRVGFIDIYGGSYLPIDTFNTGANGTGVKDKWYANLVASTVTGGPTGYHSTGTPLRSALARVGLIFAGKKPTTTPAPPAASADPMQYSCQQNFALLTTDGYWNGDEKPAEQIKGLTGQVIGNTDGGSTSRPMYEGPTATSNTLADVAKYFYDNDLRTAALGNCLGAISDVLVCTNDVFVSGTDNNVQQHMTTFTLGLGVDGSLTYTNDYKTATSGDYFNIVNGTGTSPNWTVPVKDTETAVDDLWHAAVNGRGTYFSAKNPTQLTDGLNGALGAIGSKLGAGSAAATSSLNPVAGDNFAYVASYTTVKWQGNLEARTINLNNGEVSESPAWCVENTIAASCPAPGSIVKSTDGSSSAYYCSTANATSCPNGTLGADKVCRVEVSVACAGTMGAKVGVNADTRVIKMSNGAGALVDFSYANLQARSLDTNFAGTGLSQWATFSDDQKVLAAGKNMVSYLRGQTGFEMERTSNDALNHLYRYREATLGDAIESQPAFVGKPVFKYADVGYSDYIAAKTSRAKTVYMGANDGMMHAFDATNGQERWAFVPSAVIPRLWRLADKNYANMHENYVNGRPIIADVYDTVSAAWKTILVAGLGGGGRAYYALDITDPTSPKMLWEIDSSTENNLGYSYGYPIVTKKSDGTWVVLFTSGYNNINPGNGQGYLYVRNALTGAHIARIGTAANADDATTPSGLARIASYKDDLIHNNKTVAVYGGDIRGNVWRFDINANTAMKFAILKDATGAAQPVTAAPELGLAYGKRMVFVGTGKYLELADLKNTQRQTLYAIKDNDRTVTLDNPRLDSKMKAQTLSQSGSTRKASKTVVDLRADDGWFIDLPDSGERINVEPILDSGLLIVPSTVPSDTVCSPGGYGWLNYFNYLNGNNGDGIVSEKFNAPIVGVNVYYTPDGKRHVSVVTSDKPTPEKPPKGPGDSDGALSFKGKRVIWRELIK